MLLPLITYKPCHAIVVEWRSYTFLLWHALCSCISFHTRALTYRTELRVWRCEPASKSEEALDWLRVYVEHAQCAVMTVLCMCYMKLSFCTSLRVGVME